MAKIGVIGAGSWGIALATLLHRNGHQITVWSIVEAEIKMLQTEHEHKDKLPGVKLPEDMEFTTDLEAAINGKDLLVLAVPSPYTRSTSKSMAPYVKEGQIIVNVAKGIEEATLMTLSEIIEEEIPQADVAVLSGPSHAEEVGRGIPTTIVVGSILYRVVVSVVLQMGLSTDDLKLLTAVLVALALTAPVILEKRAQKKRYLANIEGEGE